MSRRSPARPGLVFLFALCCSAVSLTAHADPDGPRIEAEGLDPMTFRGMADPVVIDRADLQTRIDALAADLATFERMLDLVRDRRERKALGDQLQVMSDRIAALRLELRNGAPASMERRRDVRRRHREERRPVPPPVVEEKPQPATGAQLASLSESLRQASFRQDKMRVLRLAVPNLWFSTGQVKQLIEHFSFGSDKVEALVMLHPRLVDPENTHTLFTLLPHASDRRKFEAQIGAGQLP